MLAFEHVDLLTQGHDLESKAISRAKESSEPFKETPYQFEHGESLHGPVLSRDYVVDTGFSTQRSFGDRQRRDLPLGCLVEAYRHHKRADAKADGYVFEKDGNPLDDRAILKDFIRPAAKRLGFYFSGFGWHSFRRQNLTRIQEEGATPFEAQVQAGHSRPTMTSDYTIVSIERRKQAVLRLQERLLGEGQSPAIN